MTLTPGQYLRTRREAAGLSIADVAERIATVPRWAQHLRRGWLAQIESDQMPASFNTIVVLHQVMQFDLAVLVALTAEGVEAPACASYAPAAKQTPASAMPDRARGSPRTAAAPAPAAPPRSNTDAA
ncbi:helix-turn-helix domain-containing protein [Sphingomonas aurantiaca]|uniref:helix-turn-helix domain-containing protein n=1 Tax=Sphingomonas aurantiaca TaxID=185949 RepID=UPI003A5BB959